MLPAVLFRFAGLPVWSAVCLLALSVLATREKADIPLVPSKPVESRERLSSDFDQITRYQIPDVGLPAHHAGNLVKSAAGHPLLFWFAGTREGASDVRILRAEFENGSWSVPESVVTSRLASHLAGRWIKKLGNPVAWRAPDGRLHLYVVTVTLGGWSGSRILHLESKDDGRTFDSGRILVHSPFLNYSTLVKSPVIVLNGRPCLPIYHEFIHKRSLLMEIGPDGEMLSVDRLGGQDGLLQPAVVRLGPNSYLAVHRRSDSLPCKVYEQSSTDGENWTPSAPGQLPNPNSAVALAKLPDGRAVIAFNDTTNNRHVLRLAVRTGIGGPWERVGPEITSSDEVSYPTLLADSDALHLAYTFDRKHLVHNRIPYAALAEAEPVLPVK